MPERVEYEHVHTCEERPRPVRDRVAVGQIREAADPQPKNLPGAVPQRDRHERQLADRERALDQRKIELRDPASPGHVLVEHIPERASNLVQGDPVPIELHGLPHHRIESPHVVKAEDVIGVTVGEHDRVDAGDAMFQGLRAQVGARVDQHARTGVAADEHRRAQAVVSRIV